MVLGDPHRLRTTAVEDICSVVLTLRLSPCLSVASSGEATSLEMARQNTKPSVHPSHGPAQNQSSYLDIRGNPEQTRSLGEPVISGKPN